MFSGALTRPDGELRFDHLGDGPDLLLLHAGGERRRVWRPVMEDLATRGYRATAYDQRGHGESVTEGDDALPALGADTAAMIDTLTRPVLVGASLGGFAALAALGDPATEAKAAGLVLVDVFPDPDPDRVRRFLAPLGMANSPRVDDILNRRDELRAITRRLTLPILAVRAGERTGITDQESARFRELAPHAHIVTVPGAGHLIAREKPAELAALIAEFLGSDVVRIRQGPAEA